MRVEEAVEILWQALQHGVHYPEALHGKLTLDEGYRVQLGVLARWAKAGTRQAGWKIGLSAEAIRRMYNMQEPVFGYLLARDGYSNGHRFASNAIPKAAIEAELCFTLGTSLRGPGVTREDALNAVAAVAPAFEVVSLRGNMATDLPLGVADNVSQWGFVTNTVLQPYPKTLALGHVTAEIRTNGRTVATLVGAEVIDDQLQSLAWLANKLAAYGIGLEPGQRVITGSFNKPLPISQGEEWESCFSSIGNVTASFV
jgi:2-keto-4-pentenoate hydratase